MNQPGLATESYLAALAAQAPPPARAPAWLHDLRRGALARFAEVGFPTTRDEDWRYTDVTPIARAAFRPAPVASGALNSAQFAGLELDELSGHRLVFVNGHYAATLSAPGASPPGVVVTRLADALTRHPHELAPYLGHLMPSAASGFAALNTAALGDGVYIRFAESARLATPIHLLYLTTDAAASRFTQPRNLVVAEAGAAGVLIEHYVALGDVEYFTNALTEIALGPNATLEHYRLQEESRSAYHVNGLHVRIGRDARYTGHAVDLGGRLVRNDLTGMLDAEGAACTLNGLYAIGGRSHVDNHTRIDHAKPRGTSREFYKGVLAERARAVFRGRVVVHADAQGSDAQQVNNNLLLSRDAEADTQPQLEIYADDVKCSHGATVGSLDEEQLFYLRSRALDAAAARDLLTYAFARDVLGRIGIVPLRRRIERRLAAGLLHGRAFAGA